MYVIQYRQKLLIGLSFLTLVLYHSRRVTSSPLNNFILGVKATVKALLEQGKAKKTNEGV
jgi:hypothetical protein